MASTIQTPVAQAIQDLFTGNLGVLASKGLMKQKGRHYPYSVSSLFANNEIGVWYDPSDFSTLFQNSAGTTPVTAVEQPVGKMLDKSGRGNHATQATSTKRPVLSAKVNLLTGSAALATQSVTTKAIPYTLKQTGTGTITLSGTSTAGPLVGPGTLTFTPTAGTLTLTVTGSVTEAQLETGSVATRYQWVNTVADYDTVGFNKYLKFDGVDDNMAIVNVSIAQPFQVFLGINNYFTGTGSGDANLLRSDTLAVGYRAGGGKNFSIYAGRAVTSTAAYIEARVERT
jgi:hypothetical protein